jgi:hypothetical protein
MMQLSDPVIYANDGVISLSTESITSSDRFCGKGYYTVEFNRKIDYKKALSYVLAPLSPIIFLVF